jgi:hypothetical protein
VRNTFKNRSMLQLGHADDALRSSSSSDYGGKISRLLEIIKESATPYKLDDREAPNGVLLRGVIKSILDEIAEGSPVVPPVGFVAVAQTIAASAFNSAKILYDNAYPTLPKDGRTAAAELEIT